MARKKEKYNGYKPPFMLSAKAVGMIADISAQMERFAIRMEQSDALTLRRANRIKTIHSSLAIEGNTLLESEVADIIDGTVRSHKGEPLVAPVNASVKYTKTQAAIIDILKGDAHATYDEMAATIGVNRTTIMRNIAALKGKGVLERVGEDKNGYWKLNNK